MNRDSSHSDTLVFFGATGDLAYKKIFPALQAMVKRGTLDVPVIGVAKAGWDLNQLKARAKDSVEKHGGLDPAAFDKLSGLLRYVDGDYNDAGTFKALCGQLGSAQRPAYYLAIPPAAFGTVVEQLSRTGFTSNARVIIEKPFGRDLTSARALNQILLKTLRRKPFSGLTITWASNRCIACCFSVLPIRCSNHSGTGRTSRRCRSRWLRISVCRVAERFTNRSAQVRDVVQNHLFQVLANLAMEPPIRTDSESIRDEKVKVLKAIAPIDPKNLVRGQFRGYRQEPGVAPDSNVETFAALKLHIDSWRWRGVPFYIRAGKSLPVTCTEVQMHLRQPPTMYKHYALDSNYVRLRISPDIVMAFGLNVTSPVNETRSELSELLASRHPCAREMDAYERVLTDAMAGDATLFAREDYVEEAWRIVDPALKAGTPRSRVRTKDLGPA
jgi:glucose-6-phosphate 1-dehydrogenase